MLFDDIMFLRICQFFFYGNQFLNDGVNSTPQATAVKLAQLGEGDSPQCG